MLLLLISDVPVYFGLLELVLEFLALPLAPLYLIVKFGHLFDVLVQDGVAFGLLLTSEAV
jgi:hypothetical protein